MRACPRAWGWPALGEHGGDVVSRIRSASSPSSAGRGLGVGGEAGDRVHVEVVALAEVAERFVADHDRAGGALLEPGAEVASSCSRSAWSRSLLALKSAAWSGLASAMVSVKASAAWPSRVGSSQKCGSAPCPPPSPPAQVDSIGGVDHVLRAVVADHLVDCGLQPLLVEDDAGRRDLRGLARRQLHVVRLDAGLGQVGDLCVVAHDPLGDVLQGVEGRHHLGLPAALRSRAPGDRKPRRARVRRAGRRPVRLT